MSDSLNEAASLAAPFEGLSLLPYRDPVGVWTIGYGSTRDINERRVTADTPAITESEAQSLLERDMKSALTTVEGHVKVDLTSEQAAALADFCYNEGAGNFLRSNVLRDLNAGRFSKVAGDLAEWDLAGGHVLAGLVRRREAEGQLFSIPIPPVPPSTLSADDAPGRS